MCVFEKVKMMFSQDPGFWCDASGNRFYDYLELGVGCILGARFALIFSFDRPGGQNS